MALSLVLRTAFLGMAAGVLPFSAAQAADVLQVVTRSPAKDAFTTFPRPS